jgi:hypothetical protein
MSSFHFSFSRRLPWPVVLGVIVTSVAAAGVVEKRALDRAERKDPPKVSCIRCHTDKATLAAIADKSGDALYLVHHGDLTRAQLKKLQTDPKNASDWK